jgi:hypothetical protein
VRNASEETMRLLTLLISILFFATLTSHSQTDSVNVKIFVTNKAENDSWLDNLANLDKKLQIEKIKHRLLADTIALTTDSSWTVKSVQPLTVEYYCRPFIKINEDTIIIETTNQTRRFISILNDTKFITIEILNADKARSQYGKWGLCGSILLRTKDKNVRNRLKGLVL